MWMKERVLTRNEWFVPSLWYPSFWWWWYMYLMWFDMIFPPKRPILLGKLKMNLKNIHSYTLPMLLINKVLEDVIEEYMVLGSMWVHNWRYGANLYNLYNGFYISCYCWYTSRFPYIKWARHAWYRSSSTCTDAY